MTYENIMLDIETLDVSPLNRAVIASVGMVRFNIRETDDWSSLCKIEREYYAELPIQPQLDAGRTINASTLRWWLTQPENVQAPLRVDHGVHEPIVLEHIFDEMETFLTPSIVSEWNYCNPFKIWANPAHFDIPKLETLFTDFGYVFPVPWWCFRDMTSYKVAAKLAGIRGPSFKLPEEKQNHNALYDAREQVLELQAWYQALRKLSKG